MSDKHTDEGVKYRLNIAHPRRKCRERSDTERTQADMILASRSSVFGAQFFGADAKKVRYIEVTDVRCLAFKAILKYIYTDEVMLTRDNALEVLRASQQYNIPSLTAKCCDFLHPLLSIDTVCDVMDEALTFDLRPMQLRCLVFMDDNTNAILKSEGFRRCSRAVLSGMLKRDTLSVDEIDVYRAVVTWAEAECRRQKLDVTPDNRRKVLGNEMFLVRVPCVTQQQFADCIVKDGLLTKDEILKVFMNYSSVTKDRSSAWVTRPRSAGLRVAERFSGYKETSFPSEMPVGGKITCVSDADVICVGFVMKRFVFKILFEVHQIERVTGKVDVMADCKGRRTVSIHQQLPPFVRKPDRQDSQLNNVNIIFDRPLLFEKDKTIDMNLSLNLTSATGILDSTFLECIGQLGKTPNNHQKCADVTIKFLKANDCIPWVSGLLLAPF